MRTERCSSCGEPRESTHQWWDAHDECQPCVFGCTDEVASDDAD